MVSAAEIATFLGRDLIGKDIVIHGVCTLDNPQANHLIFAKKYDPKWEAKINTSGDVLVLALPDFEGKLQTSHIITENPRSDFARVVQEFFAIRKPAIISPTAIVPESAKIGKNVRIGHYTVLGESVEIGDDTEIEHHVVIGDNTIIGQNCRIKSNTVIGEKGFGFDFEADMTPIEIPHVGRVIIGNHVEIGALNTIVQATIGDTIIEDYVKTDDHVHVAHNCLIGEKTLITACSELSGSITIGKRVWIGPQSALMNKITIGDDAFTGLGAIVTKSVEQNMVVVGNPAKPLKKRHP